MGFGVIASFDRGRLWSTRSVLAIGTKDDELRTPGSQSDFKLAPVTLKSFEKQNPEWWPRQVHKGLWHLLRLCTCLTWCRTSRRFASRCFPLRSLVVMRRASLGISICFCFWEWRREFYWPFVIKINEATFRVRVPDCSLCQRAWVKHHLQRLPGWGWLDVADFAPGLYRLPLQLLLVLPPRHTVEEESLRVGVQRFRQTRPIDRNELPDVPALYFFYPEVRIRWLFRVFASRHRDLRSDCPASQLLLHLARVLI